MKIASMYNIQTYIYIYTHVQTKKSFTLKFGHNEVTCYLIDAKSMAKAVPRMKFSKCVVLCMSLYVIAYNCCFGGVIFIPIISSFSKRHLMTYVYRRAYRNLLLSYSCETVFWCGKFHSHYFKFFKMTFGNMYILHNNCYLVTYMTHMMIVLTYVIHIFMSLL